MTRSALLIVAMLTACGSDPADGNDLHSLTTCDISTGSNAGLTCERGCATHHDETAIGCQAHSDVPEPNGTDVTCDGTFGLDGVIGCCATLPGTMILRFVECQ